MIIWGGGEIVLLFSMCTRLTEKKGTNIYSPLKSAHIEYQNQAFKINE